MGTILTFSEMVSNQQAIAKEAAARRQAALVGADIPAKIYKAARHVIARMNAGYDAAMRTPERRAAKVEYVPLYASKAGQDTAAILDDIATRFGNDLDYTSPEVIEARDRMHGDY